MEIEIDAQKPLKCNLFKPLQIVIDPYAQTGPYCPLPEFGNFLFFFKLAENHVRWS